LFGERDKVSLAGYPGGGGVGGGDPMMLSYSCCGSVEVENW